MHAKNILLNMQLSKSSLVFHIKNILMQNLI